MQAGMSHDSELNVIKVTYPFMEAAKSEPNNFHQIRKVQENIERRVAKLGDMEQYNQEMACMIEVIYRDY